MHAMLDGVFECRNNFFQVRRQLATTLDMWPDRDRWRVNQRTVQRDCIEIVVEIWPAPAMKGIARLPHARPAVFPTTGPPDVGAPFVGKKHISATIEALGLPLQATCARGKTRQVGVVRDNHQHVDVLRIRLDRHDRAQDGDSADARNLRDRRDKSAEAVEQVLTMTIGGAVHRPQSSGGTSLSGTNTSIERARPAVRVIKPCRSRVVIML